MRKEGRGEECDTTTHLIKIQFLPMLVVLLNLASMNFVRTDSYRDPRATGACTILLLVAVLQSHLDRQLKQSGKHSTMFKCSNTQLQNGTGGAWPSCRSRTDRQHFSVDKGSFKSLIHAYNKVQGLSHGLNFNYSMFAKISNTTSVGKNMKFNQVRGRVMLLPSPFFFHYVLLVNVDLVNCCIEVEHAQSSTWSGCGW